MLTVINGQKVRKEDIFVEKMMVIGTWKKVHEKNECTVAVVAEACRTILELHILEEAPFQAKIQKLAIGLRDTRIEMAKVQFELNLKIGEIELRAQPSTPPEVKE